MRQPPIRCLLVWGEPGSGKTIFAASSPYKPVLLLDTEDGSGLYQRELGFERIDCLDLDSIESHLAALQPGQYGTVVIDTVSAWWEAVSLRFQERDPQRFEKMSQLVWGDAKRHVRRVIRETLERCQVLVFTAHDRSDYDNKSEREPKIPSTVMEWASVSLQLMRRPEGGPPLAKVNKSRILALPSGTLLGEATWKRLLEFIQSEKVRKIVGSEPLDESLLYPDLTAPVPRKVDVRLVVSEGKKLGLSLADVQAILGDITAITDLDAALRSLSEAAQRKQEAS